MTSDQSPEPFAEQRPYQPPQIVLKIELETQAGSPLGLLDGNAISEDTFR